MKFKFRYCKEADKDHARKKRWYAHTYHHPNTICMTKHHHDLTENQFAAIMAHEYGHLLAGYEGSESDANREANKFFGIKIVYRDSSNGKHLQTITTKEAKKVLAKLRHLMR